MFCGKVSSPRASATARGMRSWSGATQRSLAGAASGGEPSGFASGTWLSERYSANRRAERFSAAQQSRA